MQALFHSHPATTQLMEVIAQNETTADLARTPGCSVEITACPISAAATVGTCTLIPDGSSAGAVRVAAEKAAALLKPQI